MAPLLFPTGLPGCWSCVVTQAERGVEYNFDFCYGMSDFLFICLRSKKKKNGTDADVKEKTLTDDFLLR